MTQEQLLRHLQYCKHKWNGYGEDVFQQACLIALQRYKTFDNVNQALFGFLCKEAARKLLKHKKFEITFSQLSQGYFSNNEEINFEDTLADPHATFAFLSDTNDPDYDDAHDSFPDKVSLSDKEQLFQLPLPFPCKQTKQIKEVRLCK
jgi:DNA-directed RNA polymerase specialized sigma24 family protein